MNDQKLALRIAFRAEGNMWNVYAAKHDTMEGAIWLGSIAMSLVESNPKLKGMFMELMKKAFGLVIKDVLGVEPNRWDTGPAPEHERTKE